MTVDALSHLSPVWNRAWPLFVERGEGAYLIDTAGRRYLDFTCGIGVTNTGHAHPRVVKAIQEQAARLIHGQAALMVHQPMLRLVERAVDRRACGLWTPSSSPTPGPRPSRERSSWRAMRRDDRT